ncbi:response regulator receiver protein [Chondrocystis sp. NIES-4102]|nr:response regulator receiver protein [Chondrocystis sp. NIES-4102]
MRANSNLREQLTTLHRQQFTGILTILSQDKKQKWEIFFYLGKYLWADGGYHINRALLRNINYYFPKVNSNPIFLKLRTSALSKYHFLYTLWQNRIISKEQIKALINNLNFEILFDLLQKESNSSLTYNMQNTSAHQLLKAGFSLSFDFIELEEILLKAQTAWSSWQSKGLASCSPNHAPLLNKDSDLKQQVPDFIFNNMSRLLNGKNTLRDLAIKMDKEVLELTYGLIPYFLKGYLRFVEIPDLPTFYLD